MCNEPLAHGNFRRALKSATLASYSVQFLKRNEKDSYNEISVRYVYSANEVSWVKPGVGGRNISNPKMLQVFAKWNLVKAANCLGLV